MGLFRCSASTLGGNGSGFFFLPPSNWHSITRTFPVRLTLFKKIQCNLRNTKNHVYPSGAVGIGVSEEAARVYSLETCHCEGFSVN